MTRAVGATGWQRTWQAAALAVVVAIHIVGGLAVRDWSRPKPPKESTGLRMQVLLLPPDPPPALPPPEDVDSTASTSSARRPMQSVAVPTQPDDPTEPESGSEATIPEPRPLAQRLFRDDGSLVLTRQMLQRIDENTGLGRVFEYQIAGLEQAGKVLERPTALVYQPTRFDGYWQPTHDVLTDMLIKAVQASTATVRIPIPGRPGWKLVCSVAVLAVSGGCGMIGPDNPMIVLNDPDTLNEDEQRACVVLWNRLAEARTQEQRIELRRLYETGCRKPPARG